MNLTQHRAPCFSPYFPLLTFFSSYPIFTALSCLLPPRKTLNWCKYPVWMNISWVEVVWLQAGFCLRVSVF